jgi:hypothetical protein
MIVIDEQAAEQRLRAEYAKEIAIDVADCEAPNVVTDLKDPAVSSNERQPLERLLDTGISTPIVGGGRRRRTESALLSALEHHHEAIGVAEGQRVNEHVIDDA